MSGRIATCYKCKNAANRLLKMPIQKCAAIVNTDIAVRKTTILYYSQANLQLARGLAELEERQELSRIQDEQTRQVFERHSEYHEGFNLMNLQIQNMDAARATEFRSALQRHQMSSSSPIQRAPIVTNPIVVNPSAPTSFRVEDVTEPTCATVHCENRLNWELPCSHLMCEACVVALHDASFTDYEGEPRRSPSNIKCPQCRAVFTRERLTPVVYSGGSTPDAPRVIPAELVAAPRLAIEAAPGTITTDQLLLQLALNSSAESMDTAA